jgi:hypothetical protein
MNKVKSLITCLAFVSLFACESRYPMDKRFWTPEDYRKVWYEINYETPKGEEFPRFANPETADVVRKIIDPQNYTSVLEDNELGLNYRSKISGEFFEHIRDITEIYGKMDVQDKFVYAEELAEIKNFFLGFQIVYFRLGNEHIASESDDRGTIRKNEQTIIGNFDSYLDDLRHEKAYGQYAVKLADGINTHFTKLIDTFPKANYSGLLATAKALQEKVVTSEIKTALSNLITKIESTQPKVAEPTK